MEPNSASMAFWGIKQINAEFNFSTSPSSIWLSSSVLMNFHKLTKLLLSLLPLSSAIKSKHLIRKKGEKKIICLVKNLSKDGEGN